MARQSVIKKKQSICGRTGTAIFQLSILLLALVHVPAKAAVSLVHGNTRDNISFLIMTGSIEPGDADRLLSELNQWSLKNQPVNVLALDSTGGRVEEGYKMMSAVLNNQISTVVMPGSLCFSACISIFAAGKQRYAYPESRMGVHRINMNGEDNALARSASIEMNKVYKYLNIPDNIRLKMLDTDPSDPGELTLTEKADLNSLAPDITGATIIVNQSSLKPVARTITTNDLKAARNLNEQAITLINQKQYIQAISLLERAKELSPTDAEILGNLGYAYYLAGDLDNAQNALTSTLQLKPKRGSSWNNLGLVLAARGDISWATEAFVRYWNYSSNKKAATNQFFYWESERPGTALEEASRRARAQLGLITPVN